MRGHKQEREDSPASGRVELWDYLRASLGAMPDGVLAVDRQCRLVFANDAGKRLLQQVPSQDVAQDDQALHLPLCYADGRPVAPEESPLCRAMRGGVIANLPLLLKRHDGSDAHLTVSAGAVRDRSGSVIGAIAYFRDVTQNVLAEQALRESEARFRRLSEATSEAILINDGGTVLEVNAALTKMFGYEPSEVVGKRGVRLLVAPESREEVLEHVQSGDERPYEAIGLRKDGTTFVMEVRGREITYEGRRARVAAIRDITERKHAEQERLRLASYVRLLLESVDEGIFGVDQKGCCLFINRSGAAMVGYQPEEVVGKSIHQLVHHSYPDGSPYPEEDCPMFHALQAGVGCRLEDEVIWRRSGTYFPAEYSSHPIVENGVIEGAVVTFVDTSARKRAQEDRERLLKDIDAQRHLFQMVIDNAPAGIAVLGGDLRVKWANPAYLQFLDEPYRSAGIAGRRLDEFLPRAVESGLVGIFDEVAATGQPHVDPEYEHHGFARGITYWRWSLLPLPMTGEDPPDLMLLVTETTEQVLARKKVEELAATAQRHAAELSGVVENMVEGVLVSDAGGQITLANKAALRLCGLAGNMQVAVAELPALLHIRHPNGATLRPEELPIIRALGGSICEQEDVIVRNPRRLRDVYIRCSAGPIRDEQGKVAGAVAVMRDVTDLAELDQLKDEFILVAAHELKTPVAVMKGYAQLLLRQASVVAPSARRMLEAIDRGAGRIDAVVQDLLDITRLHSGQLDLATEPIDLPVLVQEMADRAALTATKHRVRVVKAEPVVVHGDRGRLEQVLANLLDNAIKYSPRGGDVDVTVEVREGEAVVAVRDYGVGIPEEKQGHIFQRFYSAHTGTPYDYGGMGVGLYISKAIVTRHGGRLRFTSEPGQGSTFYFTLPIAPPAP